jgi:predicted transcriptional regulator of viral defense system
MRIKNISTQSNNILTYFNTLDQDCFAYVEAENALPNSSNSALKELLSDLVKRGLLMRLKKGLYYIIPYEKDAESFMPDWHLIAAHLTKGDNHYIGYYSALQIHNLITQPSLKEQSSHKMK